MPLLILISFSKPILLVIARRIVFLGLVFAWLVFSIDFLSVIH